MNKCTKKINSFLILLLISSTILSQATKIMSFNIRYDNTSDIENSWNNRKEKIVQLLKNYEPEIFGIQEGLNNQVTFINNNLTNYKYIGGGRDDGKLKGEYSAIYYNTNKYKVLKSSTFWLSKTPDTVSIGWDAALPRICTYGLFENINTKEKIWIFNAHFDHIGKLARENSAKLILKKIHYLNSKNYPVILMGDFNTTSKEKPIQLFKTQLDDALAISKKSLHGPIGTFNGFKNQETTRKIDFFFTKNLKVLSYLHIDDRMNNNKNISDHFPILMTIEINKP